MVTRLTSAAGSRTPGDLAHGVGGGSPTAGLQREPRHLLDRIHLRRRDQGDGRGRYIANCYNEFATFVHGTSARPSSRATSTRPRSTLTRTSAWRPTTLTGTTATRRTRPGRLGSAARRAPGRRVERALGAIRNDTPTTRPGARPTPTWRRSWPSRRAHGPGHHLDEAMKSDFEFCPNLDKLTENSRPRSGRRPGTLRAAIPGAWKEI